MKKLKIFLPLIFSFLLMFLFIPKTHAQLIIPALPFDDSYPHIISVYDFGENTSIRYVYVTYCKNENYILRSRGSNVEFGNCYDSNGNNQGYAYRRRISYADTDITWQDIINYDIDLSGKEWGSEQYDFSYSTALGWNNVDNRLSYYKDYQEELTPQGNLITLLTGNTNLYNSNGNTLLFDKSLFPTSPVEPSYTYTSTLLDNGNVKIDFQFSDYVEGVGYGFEILNFVSGEYYGTSNPYGSIFPDNIPYGSSFSVEIPYDTVIYISLYQYQEVEGTSLYSRDEVYSEEIDIDNVVFDNQQDPYFSVSLHTNNTIVGEFRNTKPSYTCKYRNSNNNMIGVVICDEETVNETFNFNGWVEFYIENSLGVDIYSRKINVQGGSANDPYIVYNIEKQDFYSVINWYVENSISDLKYRFSTDNGVNYSSWFSLDNNTNIVNVYDNTTVIIEISNHDNSIIYDSKAINVVNSLNNLKKFNNTTNNFINKFKSLFGVNTNILKNINDYWNTLKTSKIYLLIFIPFITSIICAIIKLIRR